MSSNTVSRVRRSQFERVARADVERLAAFSTSVIGDALGRRCSLGPSIQPCTTATSFAGPALTIKCSAGDNLAALVALSAIQPGDVLVIACNRSTEAAVAGGNYVALAKSRGAVAVVTDGLIRDCDELDNLSVPVFAAGMTPNGPFKTGSGEIGLPVAVGDAVIAGGDMVVGDRDGVIVVTRCQVREAVEGASVVQAREIATIETNKSGKLPDWLERLIRETPVHDIDEGLAKKLQS